MRSVLHLEHKRYFQNHGNILFEKIAPVSDCKKLEAELKQFLKEVAVAKDRYLQRWRENVYRSLPGVHAIVKKARLDRLAAELVHRSKVALVKDLWMQAEEEIFFEDCDCAVVLCLSGEKAGWALFFTGEYPQGVLGWDPKASVIILGFSSAGFPN
ncbi:DUF5070 domain-containing protein [Chlamydia muridarum str. Nigg]|jgi:hypothetical protein|nr:DUF5070 domain-containing protein [Chlamydia muridarum]UFT48547.1 DUF5070 domain-containing protein [Chlamydia trachomatis]AHH22957.1 hypothetical protein TAC_02995 [Chlamydia muridarum str. Nigg3 CMUT3-5]AHH23882.1 hypothetical protein Y015_02995 [Chlamydia muridarum str. Nigg CM972]AID38090.1 hypothetical protein BB17_03045 [Chlamydia muridarum str. Nigg 2 MCR]AIT90747.1 hypothetical protein NC80_02860 [Chlamydia muridarum]